MNYFIRQLKFRKQYYKSFKNKEIEIAVFFLFAATLKLIYLWCLNSEGIFYLRAAAASVNIISLWIKFYQHKHDSALLQ